MRPVEHALWLIETRLGENPNLADIARETGLSRYWICRLFAEETGTTPAAYVRARRLTEAAKALLAGAPDILHVALDAGYGSHEAFTRAFRAEFDRTPEDVRAHGLPAGIRLKEPLRMTSTHHAGVAAPTLATLPPARYVGLERRHAMTQLGGIPPQWLAFNQQHLSRLDPARVPAAYGIVRHDGGDGDELLYLCAVPASCGLAGPDLVEWSLPELRVAQFVHEGHVAAIGASLRTVFDAALPAAGLKPAEGIDLIEVYGPRFDPRSGLGTVGLWVPVKAVAQP